MIPEKRNSNPSGGIPPRRTALPPKREPASSEAPKTALPPRRDGAGPSSRDLMKEKQEEVQQTQGKGGAVILLSVLLLGAISAAGFFYLQGQYNQDDFKTIETKGITSKSGANVIFEGNSLTANKGGIAGGGSSWPTKLMKSEGWNQFSHENYAEGGNLQTQDVEPRISRLISTVEPSDSSPRYFFLWSGINDITKNVPAHRITASLRRSIQDAKSAGLHVVILPLTPVANNSDRMGYGYNLKQQAALNSVNQWISSEGASLADQYLNINLIPEIKDPTNSRYYVDGLHQTDLGRAKISQFVASKIRVPKH